jgi:hypothetical protein
MNTFCQYICAKYSLTLPALVTLLHAVFGSLASHCRCWLPSVMTATHHLNPIQMTKQNENTCCVSPEAVSCWKVRSDYSINHHKVVLVHARHLQIPHLFTAKCFAVLISLKGVELNIDRHV